MPHKAESEMFDVNLNTPTTPDDLRQTNLIGSNPLGKAEQIPPYMDLEYDETSTTTTLEDSKPYLRFFAVGPSSYRVICPLCRQSARTETVQMSGMLGQLSCLLSAFSCCFPIFSLTFVYMCLQSRLKSKRIFCSSCGGHLGYYYRPS